MFLIVGGAGFIGSHLVEEVVKRFPNQGVVIFDNFSTGKEENLSKVNELKQVQILRGDIRDERAVLEACKGVHTVFHLAAFTSVPGSVIDPRLCNDINISGTLQILWACREARVKRLLFASSSAVYGDGPETPKTETLPLHPISPYAVSKGCGETYCELFSRLYGLKTTSFRFFNVYGPRQDPNSQYAAVIPKFISAMSKNTQPRVFGDGKQTRDFVFVKDVVQVLSQASLLDLPGGGVYNVGTGKAISLLELLEYLKKIFKRDPDPIYMEAVKGEVRHSVSDIEKMRSELKINSFTSVLEGLEETVSHFLRLSFRDEKK